MEKISTSLAIIMVTMLIAGTVVFSVVRWGQLKEKELNAKAINDCASVAVSAPPGGFSGVAVYKVCVEDKGYKTVAK